MRYARGTGKGPLWIQRQMRRVLLVAMQGKGQGKR